MFNAGGSVEVRTFLIMLRDVTKLGLGEAQAPPPKKMTSQPRQTGTGIGLHCLKWTKFGQLIRSKVVKIVATRVRF